MTPLRIAYLLEDTHIAGGIRVAAAHADALTALGHDVTLITKGDPLTWRQSRAKWEFVASFEDADVSRYEFVVGTFWKTLDQTYVLAGERAIHLCQGYEGSFTAYQPFKEAIDAAYRLPIPKITVSPHLVDVCRKFHPDATWIGQIVDEEFYQTRRDRAGRPRVLLVGPAQADFKGIDVGYDAVRRARELGAEFDLVRVSQWHPADGEPVELAAEFHQSIPSQEMVRIIATADIVLGPSRWQEGFGLPAAESMASGVPAILSEIPSFLSWDAKHDYALFVPEGDGAAMGDALARLLRDDELRRRLGARGREVVEQFRAERTGRRLEEYFRSRR